MVQINMLLLLLTLTLATLRISAQSCFTCSVPDCNTEIQLPSTSALGGTGQTSCASLNTVLNGLPTSIDPTTSCTAGQVTSLMCEAIISANQTQSGCDSTTISTPSTFGADCTTLQSCMTLAELEVMQSNQACASAPNFVNYLTTFEAPPTNNCSACVFTACPALGNFTLEFGLETQWLTGDTCTMMNQVTALVGSSPAIAGNPDSLANASSSVCAGLTFLLDFDTADEGTGVCQLLDLRQLVDEGFWTYVAPANVPWVDFCPTYLPTVYSAEVSKALLQNGFCSSPAIGLFKLANQLAAGQFPGNGAAERTVAVTAALTLAAALIALIGM